MSAMPAVSSRFTLVRCLGEGGMGTVYEAVDTTRGERVALKVLRSTTPESLARFKREFRALQDVTHPNLVTLGELVSEGARWFFTMELVKGEDFVSWVTTVDDPPEDQPQSAFAFDEHRLRDALVQLARGLGALHDAHMVHRDVKPSNVLVTSAGRLVLLDFGLISDLTPDFGPTMTDLDVVGTPTYMAPEQAASRAVGPAADFYAMGVLLFEALTGQLPFQGAPLEVLLRKQKDEAPRPSAIVPNVPPDLDDLCERLLRFDPGARPTASRVLDLLDVTRVPERRKPASSHSVSLGVPFIGREPELVELRRAYADAQTGRTVTMLVRGESGIGKSCLVRHFMEANASQDRDLLILAGRCYERETVPYKAFDGVVDALARTLGRMSANEAAYFVPTRPGPLVQVFPMLKRVEAIAHARTTEAIADPHEVRTRAFGAMRELLLRLADRRPVVILIDDLQWADADSFALLHELLRPPDEPALLLIATVRDESPDTLATKREGDSPFAFPGDVRTVRLERLGPSDARALVGRLVERIAPGMPIDAERLAREADGHPLFIDELVRHLFLVGDASPDALKLGDALWARIASLDDLPRRIAESVAIAGTPVPVDVVCKAVEAQPGDFARLVSFLRVAHLVRTTGARGNDTIECFHGRVREAVMANLDAGERRRHHYRLAVALEAAPNVDADLLAIHWLGAGDVANAARHMLAAADRAASMLAFDRAARLYERALQLRGGSEHRVARVEERALQTKLGDALANAGRGAQAARAYRAAAVGANGAEVLDLSRRAADQLLRSGHFDEGLEAIQDVLASVGMRLPTAAWRVLLALLFWRAVLAIRGFGYRLVDASEVSERELTKIDVCYAVATSLSLVDPVRGQLFQQRNILLSLRRGEAHRVARALAIEVSYRGMAGARAWEQTRAVAEEAQRVAALVGDPKSIAWSLATSAVAHYLAGHFETAVAMCDRAEKIFTEQCVGSSWEAFTMRLFALQSLVQLGSMKEVSSRQATSLRYAIERGDLYAATNLRIGYASMAWLVTGEPERARTEAREAMRQWSSRGFHLEHYYEILALTNADLYDGDARAAYDRLASCWSTMSRSLIMRVQAVRIMARHLRGRAAVALAAIDPSKRPALLASARKDARAIAREHAAWGAPLGTGLVAAVAHLNGQTTLATAQLEATIRTADEAKLALVAASARRALGLLNAGDGGRRLVESAEAQVARDGVKEPAKLLAMTLPGFGPR